MYWILVLRYTNGKYFGCGCLKIVGDSLAYPKMIYSSTGTHSTKMQTSALDLNYRGFKQMFLIVFR